MYWDQSQKLFIFTEEEIEHLKTILSGAGYHSEDIQRFFGPLRGNCTDYRFFLDMQPNNANSLREIDEAIPVLKKAIKVLKRLKSGAPVPTMRSVPDIPNRQSFFEPEEKMTKLFFDTAILASHASKDIEKIISILEENKPERPGKGRIATEGGFASAISSNFKWCFGHEPSTKLLSEIICFCLEGMGRKSKDPSRRLRK